MLKILQKSDHQIQTKVAIHFWKIIQRYSLKGTDSWCAYITVVAVGNSENVSLNIFLLPLKLKLAFIWLLLQLSHFPIVQYFSSILSILLYLYTWLYVSLWRLDNNFHKAYQRENASSRTITEIKQRWAWLVLGWDTVQVLPECCHEPLMSARFNKPCPILVVASVLIRS